MGIIELFNNCNFLLYFGSFLFYGYYGNTYTQSILIYSFFNVCDFCNKNKRVIDFIDFVKKFSSFYKIVIIDGDDTKLKDTNDKDSKDSKDSKDNTITEIIAVVPKYEVKYLDSIRRLNKEWTFTEEETVAIINITENLFGVYKKQVQQKKRESINVVMNEINNLKLEILENENEDIDDIDYCEDEADDDFTTNKQKMAKIATLQIECNKLEKELVEDGVDVNHDELKIQSKKEATQTIINKKLDKIANNYVMESTPSGNVIMIYDKVKESFKYYSDNNIPYRFLEVVSRKYVKMFDCRPLYVDMEEELRLLDEKELKERELKEKELKDLKEREDKEPTKEKELKPIEPKNVFAKFKKYNKEAGTKISMAAAPPKNSIPNANFKNPIKMESPEKLILKDTANRYTYEGKFANFNFLKKVEKKVFNKKLGLSFADFKKMKQII